LITGLPMNAISFNFKSFLAHFGDLRKICSSENFIDKFTWTAEYFDLRSASKAASHLNGIIFEVFFSFFFFFFLFFSKKNKKIKK